MSLPQVYRMRKDALSQQGAEPASLLHCAASHHTVMFMDLCLRALHLVVCGREEVQSSPPDALLHHAPGNIRASKFVLFQFMLQRSGSEETPT